MRAESQSKRDRAAELNYGLIIFPFHCMSNPFLCIFIFQQMWKKATPKSGPTHHPFAEWHIEFRCWEEGKCAHVGSLLWFLYDDISASVSKGPDSLSNTWRTQARESGAVSIISSVKAEFIYYLLLKSETWYTHTHCESQRMSEKSGYIGSRLQSKCRKNRISTHVTEL